MRREDFPHPLSLKCDETIFDGKMAIILTVYIYIIDQVQGQDGWIFAKFSFCVFMDRDEVEVYTQKENEANNQPS